MKINDLFTRLSFGELSALAIGMEGTGSIREADQPKILSYTNAALTSLFTRFIQRRHFLTFVAQPALRQYVMSSRHAVTGGGAGPAYILDSDDLPFQDDLIKILAVEREDDPETFRNDSALMGINRRGVPDGVEMVSHDTLLFREQPKPGVRFLVEYQAKHPRLQVPVDLEADISIMPSLEEALQLKVAAGVFSGMTSETATAKSMELEGRYEALCLLAEANDLTQESGSDQFDRLRDRGFI